MITKQDLRTEPNQTKEKLTQQRNQTIHPIHLTLAHWQSPKSLSIHYPAHWT